MIACHQNNLSLVTALLNAGANPNVCNEVNPTVTFVLNDSFIRPQAGQTPLLLAVLKNNMAMVQELVLAGVDVNHSEKASDVHNYIWLCLTSVCVVHVGRPVCSDGVL